MVAKWNVQVMPQPRLICQHPFSSYSRNDNGGDLMVRGFWSHGTDCIIVVRIQISIRNHISKRAPIKFLTRARKEM
eukprot:scaffold85703_cov47-Attheya_sp.AAC.2